MNIGKILDLLRRNAISILKFTGFLVSLVPKSNTLSTTGRDRYLSSKSIADKIFIHKIQR